MAWSTSKKLGAAAFAACIFVITLSVVLWTLFRGGQPEPGALAGAWEGTLRVGEAQLRLVARLEATPDGHYRATMDSVHQGALGLPIPTLAISRRRIRLLMPALNAEYSGTLSPDLSRWEGSWIQAGSTYPLSFYRTNSPSTVTGPRPDSDYVRRRDFDVQGRWEGRIQVNNIGLRLRFHIHQGTNDSYEATLDSVDQGARGMRVSQVTARGSNVVMRVDNLDGTFEGEINKAATEIDGMWTQGGGEYELLLTRMPETAVAAAQASGSSAKAGATNVHPMAGPWRGTLKANGVDLRLRITLSGDEDSGFNASLDSLDQGVRDIPTSDVHWNAGAKTLRCEWKGLAAVFNAKLDGDELDGEWKQGPVALPLVMEREEPSEKPK